MPDIIPGYRWPRDVFRRCNSLCDHRTRSRYRLLFLKSAPFKVENLHYLSLFILSLTVMQLFFPQKKSAR